MFIIIIIIITLTSTPFFFRIKATRNLSEELGYRAPRVRKLSRAFLIGMLLAISIKIGSFAILLLKSSASIKLGKSAFRIIYIVLESVFTFIVVSSYATFGIIMVLARKYEQLPIRHIIMPQVSARIRRAKTKQEIYKVICSSDLLSLVIIIIIHHHHCCYKYCDFQFNLINKNFIYINCLDLTLI